MSRPITLIGLIILILAIVLYFTKVLTGDLLTITIAIGAVVTIAGVVTGK